MQTQINNRTNHNTHSPLRLILLIGIWFLVFRPEVTFWSLKAWQSSETAHALIVPAAILLLICLRGRQLKESLAGGSLWGITVIVLGIFIFGAATWPFSFGYARQWGILLTLAGIIAAGSGWRTLKLSVPMLLLVGLSIPIGTSFYAGLIIRPETYTISATARILDFLPGIDTTIRGIDIFISGEHGPAVIALGQSNRGAHLLQGFMALGIFIAFSRIRTWPRLIAVAAAAVPVVFFCNLLRFLVWAAVVIYTAPSPDSSLPRIVSSFVSLLTAYGLFAGICAVRFNLFVEDQMPETEAPAGDSEHEQVG